VSGHVDLLIVGSGPSSAQAARAAIDRGLSVLMVDVGHEDTAFALSVPDRPFDELRRTDPAQARYFRGESDPPSQHGRTRVGSQLTPPRQFIKLETDRYLPFESSTFFPLQTLALGGLGAGWGAGALTFEDFELAECGLSWRDLEPYYREVADDIGVSGAPEDDTGPMVLAIPNVQRPLDVDTNAQSLLATYRRKRAALQRRGFYLGRSPSAILSAPLRQGASVREPNAYHDMDFYSDHQRSVYRPRFTIEALMGHQRFEFRRGLLVSRFSETPDGVRLECTDVTSGERVSFEARALALGAGAINSARIVLSSFGAFDTKVPLLCNPYNYVACLNLPMLGRPAADRRHSMSQLTGVLTAPRGGAADRLILSIFSYRSLLLFRLVREMPLPPVIGLQLARLMLTSLTILGVHHVDRQGPGKWLELRRRSDGREVLAGHYEPSSEEVEQSRRNLVRVRGILWALGCVPLTVLSPAPGASIHYAGTLPMATDPSTPLRCDRRGKLNGTQGVYLVDSAPWTFLPAKGPTFTQMANARRVVACIARDLRI
jgi:GMC oxidoreductase